MENEKGFVYILTNESFREDWVKIGRSSRPVDVRSKELDNTAVPLPFDIYATLQTTKYKTVEGLIHRQIDRLNEKIRVRSGREFFNVKPEVALDILIDIAKVIEDAVVVRHFSDHQTQIYPIIETDAPEKSDGKHQRKNFQFDMVDLHIGDEVVFIPLKLPVKIASLNQVEYKGKLWTLSAFTKEFMPEEKRCKSEAYQGPKFFSYNGKDLAKLRDELESK